MQSIADWCEASGYVSFFEAGRARHVKVDSPAGEHALGLLRDEEGSALVCQACGKQFRSSHSDARFCTSACAQKAARKRRSKASRER